ncbi:MAG: thioredoxin domain-containing protein, partial [Microbacterium sp.]|nr:thioredoxin domain-containing protein [Microbacterium sp.]
AASVVHAYAASALSQPFAHGSLLRVAAGLVDPPRQIVVVTDDPAGALAVAARRADADVVGVVSPAQAEEFAAAGFELFAGRSGTEGLAYDCRGFVCLLPVSEPHELSRERVAV